MTDLSNSEVAIPVIIDFDFIARVAHEINRAYCEALGDTSQPLWRDTPKWQKQSAVNGVVFHSDNPGALPEESHENWMAHKLHDGWKYGPVKDAQKKEHPQLVLYTHLPVEQKAKDYLFRAVVRSLLES